MKQKKRLGNVIGIILTYNCERFLKDLVARIPKDVFEQIFIVDDGSTDKTVQVAKRLGVPCISHAHMGYGGNVVYGLKKAYEKGADFVVEIHGDGQYDPQNIPSALRANMGVYDLLIGSRFLGSNPLIYGMPWFIYYANRVLSFLDRIFLGISLSEFHTGFHIYSKKFIETIRLDALSQNHVCSFEIIAAAKFHGLRIREVPIRCDYHKAHTSMGIGEGIRFSVQMFGVIALYWLAKFRVYTVPIFSTRS